jgi:hypothetical protein
VALILEPDVVRQSFLHEPSPGAIKWFRKAIEAPAINVTRNNSP